MNSINNLKLIREIYGATQEQIARALSVNRVTVANWESGSTVASNANREKMSMYYGIGPEYFYEQELTDEVRQQIQRTAEKERSVVSQSEGHKNKQDDFQKMFLNRSFDRITLDYMFSMKMLLAKADEADLDKLRTVLTINQKMGMRLESIIKLREEEAAAGDMTLFDLMEQLSDPNN